MRSDGSPRAAIRSCSTPSVSVVMLMTSANARGRWLAGGGRDAFQGGAVWGGWRRSGGGRVGTKQLVFDAGGHVGFADHLREAVTFVGGFPEQSWRERVAD